MSVNIFAKLLFVSAACMISASFASLGCSHNENKLRLVTELKVGYGIKLNLTTWETAKCFTVNLLCNDRDTLDTTDGLAFRYVVDYNTVNHKNIDSKFGYIAANRSTVFNMELINEKTLRLSGNNHRYDQELLPSRCTQDFSMQYLIITGDVSEHQLDISFSFPA